MGFNCRKCRRWWFIYNCTSPSALHSCAESLKGCPGPGWRLSAVTKLLLRRAEEDNWDSKAWRLSCPLPPFFSFSFALRKNIPTVTPLPSEGEPFSSRNLKQGSALFRNSQVTIQVFPLAKEKDKIQVFIKKTQLSSHSPAVTLSLSHPGGFPALPSFISILPPLPLAPFTFLSQKLSAAAAFISSFQFPFHFLYLKIGVSLMLTTSSLSVSASHSPGQTPSSWWLPGLCARWDAN